jgi:hypothetical protein
MDGYMQIAQTNFPEGTPFWTLLYYFHGNPPLLSILHHVNDEVSGSIRLLFFEFLLPVLHAGSMLFFSTALRGFKLRIPSFLTALLFLNPLIFLYFRYPFYSCLLFFLNAVVLSLLSGLKEKPLRIFGIAAIFSIESLLRTCYSPYLLFLLVLFLMHEWNWKRVGLLGLFFLPTLVWQHKNYLIVGKFTSSTWTGMNLARGHLPWNVHNQTVDFIPTFSMPNRYFELLSDDPRVAEKKIETNWYLSQNNLNHAVIPVVSDLYMESMRKEFSLTWSLNTLLNGVLILFKSPANYQHIRQHIQDETGFQFQGWNPDFWEPFGLQDRDYNYLFLVSKSWDPDSTRFHAWKRVSLYTIVYPFLLFFFGFRFRKLHKQWRAVFMMTVFFTLLYSSADVLEANRMRMEYEVFFYFLLAVFLNRKSVPSLKKKVIPPSLCCSGFEITNSEARNGILASELQIRKSRYSLDSGKG